MKHNRREFIRKSIIGATALSLTPKIFGRISSVNSISDIGIILNTVKPEMETDYLGTLRKLKEIGYTYLEGGTYGNSPEEYVKQVKDIGLKILCGGSSMHTMIENPDKYLKIANDLGYKYIVCYYPWITSAEEITRDAAYKAATMLNDLGAIYTAAGYNFVWHNHNWEFIDQNGEKPFDIIMQNTDPKYVSCQLDLYWVKKGNTEPVGLFKKYPGRFPLVHVKDMDSTKEKSITCVGNGVINFSNILKYHSVGGIKHCIIEHEKNNAGLSCAESSYQSLSNTLKEIGVR